MDLKNAYRTYGILGLSRLSFDVLATRLTVPRARIIRRPVYIRGRRWIQFGPGLTTGVGLRLDAWPGGRAWKERGIQRDSCGPVITFGEDVQINDYVHIGAIHSVKIGNRVLIASKVLIIDHNHGVYHGPGPHQTPELAPQEREEGYAPIVIEDDVWLGEMSAVLPGITIGRGAVVGALSLVNRDVEPYTLVAGNPARLLKRYNFVTSAWEKV
jgi:lipopolysaccharide O-acetyltransferase